MYRTVDFYPAAISEDRKTLEVFLSRQGLDYEDNTEYACGIVDEDGTLCAAGCCSGSILKQFAVIDREKGNNLLGTLIPRLTADRYAAGFTHLFIYTKPEKKKLFVSCGFYPVAETKDVLLLENGFRGIERFCKSVRKKCTGIENAQNISAVVMHANPFTRGHRALVEAAAEASDLVMVFVVEDGVNDYPFEDRIDLVKRGTADLANVAVVGSGLYIISGTTFPTYFLKEKSDSSRIQAELDAAVFAERIAPALGIKTRYVGSEPSDALTAQYNETLKSVLTTRGIAVKVIPRKTDAAGNPISASAVRGRLAAEGIGDWLTEQVPFDTEKYLKNQI